MQFQTSELKIPCKLFWKPSPSWSWVISTSTVHHLRPWFQHVAHENDTRKLLYKTKIIYILGACLRLSLFRATTKLMLRQPQCVVSRSNTDTTRQHFSERVTGPSQRQLPVQLTTQETNIHALSRIRTHNPNNLAAADIRL